MNGIPFYFEMDVRCTDGPGGRLHRLVVDMIANSLIGVAVKPRGFEFGRLVPAKFVESADRDGLQLRCSVSEFTDLETAEETAQNGTAGGVSQFEQNTGYGNQTTTRDRIATDGVELWRGQLVYATDGEIGPLQGLIVDLPGYQVTHLIVNKGRLWGRTRISVPIGTVALFGDGIQLDLAKAQLDELL